ncbi:glycoside hydrolase family 32 protein [Terrimonas pollutisoli]|uniref:glycoside hydrolase family 32 protein n=1 Tax=Terrimonas pollutisoli TaxID=3034147 RepID=UPI0023EDDBB9|nr:GH32 C-terminal domain-containing protein [Terrimonas sp. H1YJ31]
MKQEMAVRWLISSLILSTTMNVAAQYDEKYRPQFHLSSKSSSMADPKGLFIFDGTYHLFWYGQWEHAVSNDLIHWRELPKPMKRAPRPFSYFTGSVAVDTNNTSGFGENSMIAVYTRHFQGDSLPESQAISVSTDGGREFNYYDRNPVLDINKKYFRDPQVFWHKLSSKWKMVVALPDQHQIPIYESADLKEWKFCSSFGDLGARNSFWECPDLFELPVIGSRNEKKWIMIIGRGPNKVQYFIGDFDGKTFIPDSQMENYLKDGKGLKGMVYDDFESESFTKWQVEGDAFAIRKNIADGKDYLGKSYAGSLSGDNRIGRIRSRSFRIKQNAINFLIGGGQNSDSLSFRLVVDGKTVRSATGNNSPVLKWFGWDVRDLKGKEAYFELTDKNTESKNGSIAVDHIMFADNLLSLQAEHALWLDYGEDFYATKTWRNYDSNKDLGDSVIMISWLGNWRYARTSPTSWGTGFQSVPRYIALKKFPEGIRLIQQPIDALKGLRREPVHFTNRTISGIMSIPEFKPARNMYEIEAVFKADQSFVFGFDLLIGEGRKLRLSYDPKLSIFCIDRTNCTDFITDTDFTKKFATKMFAPVEPESNLIKLHILIDQSSVEVFTNQGKVVLSAVTYPSPNQTGIQVFSEKGKTQLVSFKAWQLSSIW